MTRTLIRGAVALLFLITATSAISQGGPGGGGGGGKTCPTGYGDCDGTWSNKCEVNLQTDVSNCGACGKTCGPYTNAKPACTNGTCEIASCTARGYADCDKDPSNGCEVNFYADDNNCGGCGKVCSLPNATPLCESGVCYVASCDTGYGDCDREPRSGCEINLQADVKNCGACGTLCGNANATAACTNGTCQIASCANGYADCDKGAENGCETNIGTDANNCGACGKTCGSLPNATSACTNGTCGIASCSTGYADCDKSASNGCESNIQTDVSNCGACGNSCGGILPTGATECRSGTCQMVCSAGLGDCDKSASNGCEIDLNSDANNCGACGKVCSFPNATSACANGTCQIASCATGYGDCDGNPSNGCETNILTDAENCSACGNMCSVPGATPRCTNGTCGIEYCEPGFADCDQSPSNGCESNLQTDRNNCGTCGTLCGANFAGSACTNGTCEIVSCVTGYTDCDGKYETGCEARLSFDKENCGACGNKCPDRATNASRIYCSDGSCKADCYSPYSDCDGKLENGCEVDLARDVNNCDGCGKVCGGPHATSTCISATCKITDCDFGYHDCDRNPWNGCEVFSLLGCL